MTRRIGGGRIRAAREGLELEMKALEKERRGLGIGLDLIFGWKCLARELLIHV